MNNEIQVFVRDEQATKMCNEEIHLRSDIYFFF